MKIVTDGHPALRQVAEKVTTREIADPLFQQFIDDMFLTMYATPTGVGLAAPQVGISKQLFIMDLSRDEERKPIVVINPKIRSAKNPIQLTEACLSVPNDSGTIMRFSRIMVSGLDRQGCKIHLKSKGLLAQCLQHEIDHLQGKLYIDNALSMCLKTKIES